MLGRRDAREILDRIGRLETEISDLRELIQGASSVEAKLRTELNNKREHVERLAKQSLDLVALLDDARRRIEELENGTP